jgi:hypothetical protein
MAATLEIHFLTLKYTHCQFCQNYPKKVAKIKLILAKLAFATNYEVWGPKPIEIQEPTKHYTKPLSHVKLGMWFHINQSVFLN